MIEQTRRGSAREGPPGEAPGAKQALLSAPGDGRALAVMTAGHAVQHFYVAGLAVVYPFVVADLHVSYALLGAVLTVAGLVGGLLQGAAGSLGRLRARSVLAAQNAGLGLSSLLGALAGGFGLFAGARVLGALVSWPQHPVGSAYLSERFPHRRGTVLSWHVAGGSLGTVTVPLIVTAVTASAGWRWALVVLASALAAGAVLVGAGLPSEQTGRAEAGGSAGTGGAGGPAGRGAKPGAFSGGRARGAPVRLAELLRRREVVAVLAAST